MNAQHKLHQGFKTGSGSGCQLVLSSLSLKRQFLHLSTIFKRSEPLIGGKCMCSYFTVTNTGCNLIVLRSLSSKEMFPRATSMHFIPGLKLDLYPMWSFNPKRLIFVALCNDLIDYFIVCLNISVIQCVYFKKQLNIW